VITSRVRVRDGIALAEGDAEVPGVPGSGSSIMIDFGEGSSVLGRGLLPTGSVRDTLSTPSGTVEVSIVDAGNPVVFVRPEAAGLSGAELPRRSHGGRPRPARGDPGRRCRATRAG